MADAFVANMFDLLVVETALARLGSENALDDVSVPRVKRVL